MQVYIDITLLPENDIGRHFLWEKFFCQVHIALVENLTTEGHSLFGITFPEFNDEKQRLGRKLRLFAPNKALMETLNIHHWLKGLTDYVHITSIRSVPKQVKDYVCFYRVQTKSSPERLARRAAKRHDISLEQAEKQRTVFKPTLTKAPYIWSNSLSSGGRFRLFISRKYSALGGTNHFTAYGLGKSGGSSALPQF